MTPTETFFLADIADMLGSTELAVLCWAHFSFRYDYRHEHHELAYPLRSPTNGPVHLPGGGSIAILVNESVQQGKYVFAVAAE